MRQYTLIILAVLALALGSSAADAPKVEVFGGYSYLRAGTGTLGSGAFNSNGWTASTTGKLTNILGVTAEFNGQYKNGIDGLTVKGSDYNFLFGPQVGYRTGKLRPFAHTLFGVSRLSSSGVASQNSFAMAYGGGLDLKASRLISVRLGQLDYLRTQFSNDSQNHLRYSAGLVFNLK